MPTIEEMDEHRAYLKAHLKKCHEDNVAEITEELKTEKNPYFRESLEKRLDESKRVLESGTFD